MRTFNILEVVRTGVIALQKGGGKICAPFSGEGGLEF